ncbi:hypothetical protein L4C36_23470 [Photobacterium japonica]|uniref:hypothetical protein n=1 Tax=Photobacterium japonica TaxID=2910235 RepID=UPI003D123D35
MKTKILALSLCITTGCTTVQVPNHNYIASSQTIPAGGYLHTIDGKQYVIGDVACDWWEKSNHYEGDESIYCTDSERINFVFRYPYKDGSTESQYIEESRVDWETVGQVVVGTLMVVGFVFLVAAAASGGGGGSSSAGDTYEWDYMPNSGTWACRSVDSGQFAEHSECPSYKSDYWPNN